MYRRLVGTGAAALLSLAAAPTAHAAHAAPEPLGSRTPVGAAQPPVTVGHRGAAAHAPENTLASVRKTDALGIAWVENDVQRTRDGKLVVIHDTTLNRTTNVEELFPERSPWKVADFTLAEIQRLDAGSWFDRAYAGEPVPTLKGFVDELDRTGQSLLLEAKAPELYPGIEQQILAVLAAEGWLDGGHVPERLVVQSFSADSVETTHKLCPAVKTAFLGNPAPDALPRYAAFADQINPRYTTVTASYVREVHSLKGPHHKPLEVFTWTVDDAAEAVRMEALGVDGIISNAPDVVRDAIG